MLAEKDEVFALALKKNLQKQIKHLNLFTSKKLFELLDKNYSIEISSVKKFKILRGLTLSGVCFVYFASVILRDRRDYEENITCMYVYIFSSDCDC